MIVADASAFVHVFTSKQVDRRLIDLLGVEPIIAPQLLDYEVLHAVRGLVLGRKLPAGRGEQALDLFRQTMITRHPVGEMSHRIWQLRDRMTVYDASYVALAETLDCPLVTTDRKLRGSDHRARIEVFGAAKA